MKNTKDFSRIIDKNGKIIGVLNFNNMLPVHERLISKIDINIRSGDNKSDRAYKQLLKDQLYWCNDNIDTIVNKANKLYKIITETPDKMRDLTRRCCDFKKLEKVLERWTEKGKMSDNGT
ncbi:MAG: type III toxin-antitoxin system ToxN/AbiQ family toxin [Butyrivibrio sp.]|nr:type III toxin-antitoxin system ToxN/AbiQ family toxin [Muribaculum sp.]MCM1551650.1 type III toxin-antitoxin system ToxN/AbiQ family toxin [Butyrivibrio sp.]